MISVPTIVLIDILNGASARGAGDRREPDLHVAVLRHELGRRAVLAMAGDRL